MGAENVYGGICNSAHTSLTGGREDMSFVADECVLYFCIQIEGGECFPYGVCGPFRTYLEAQQALLFLVDRNSSERFRICEAGWFDSPLEIKWDRRFE